MRVRLSHRVATSLACFALLLLAGCARERALPSEPDGIERSDSAGMLPAVPDTTATRDSMVTAGTLITLTQPVSGARADTLEAGCVRLAVPAGAIAGEAVIDLKARSDGRMVELHITPADKNGFWVPVELSADLSLMAPSIREEMAWFWVDPATGDWVLLEDSRLDPATGRVTASLHHFSIYALANRNQGRAGW